MQEYLQFQETIHIASPELTPGQIHLWWVPLTINDKQEQQFKAELSQRQRQKFDRILDPQQQQFYVAGRGYLNQLLRHYLGEHASIDLCFGEHGKPALRENPLALNFNYTDTNGYGLFAFALTTELGVDLESAERESQFARIVERRFAIEEQYLRDGSVSDFLRCWTRKEAYGKAIGRGLSYPLRECLICEDVAQSEFAIPNEPFYGQQIIIQSDDIDYIACVVSQEAKPKNLLAFHLLTAVD